MSETRYIRLVDRQPAYTRYTGVGDVPSSVEVSMEFESAVTADELGTVTVPLVDVPAFRAFLRGVSGVHENHGLAKRFGFIPEELFELVETPAIQVPIELCTSPLLDPDLRQVFEREDRVLGISNLFRDAMVDISHKPSFSPAQAFQFAFGGSSAFRLKVCPKMLVPSPDGTGRAGVEEGTVRTDRDVLHAPVDPEDANDIGLVWGWQFYLDMEVKMPVGVRECRTFNRSLDVLAVTVRQRELCTDSAAGGGNRREAVQQTYPDDPLVVPDGGERSAFWKPCAFGGFQRITRAISSPLHQRRREIRYRSPNIAVRGSMVSHLVISVVRKPPPCRRGERFSVRSHCVTQCRSSAREQLEFDRNRAYHTHMFCILHEKGFGGDTQTRPSRHKHQGLRAARIMKFTVDRIEEGILVLLLRVDEGVKVEIPSVLAPGICEGDIVDLTITKDETETDAAKQRVSSLIEKLKNKK